MRIEAVLAALNLPAGARVDRRVPKKLLIENGAPTAADKRRITDGVETATWLAALKPTTIAVPEYRDNEREYLELAVLSVELRPAAQSARLAELIHRAVPYPVLLLAAQHEVVTVSLAHKRWSQGTAGATVLDGEMVAVGLGDGGNAAHVQAFLDLLSLTRCTRPNLYALYEAWIEALLALQVAQVTGAFSATVSPEQTAVRRRALEDCARLEAEAARLRAAADGEEQIPRQVDLNLELKRVEAALSDARARLRGTRTP